MKKRIVLVDDEAYVTTILAGKLRQAGHEVFVGNNGEEGFALVSSNLPDLVISDFEMPAMTGYEMSVKLKQQPATQSIPVLMLTARGHHLSEDDLKKTNIRQLFSKPFSAKTVVAKVTEILEGPGNAESGAS